MRDISWIPNFLKNFSGPTEHKPGAIEDFKFCSHPDEIVHRHQPLALEPIYQHRLSELVFQLKPKRYAVIGVLFGTTESFLLQCQNYHPDLIVACDVDLADYNPKRDTGTIAYRNICGTQYGNFQGEFVYCRADSKKTDLFQKLGQYDFVFVDGEHTKEAAYSDLNKALSSLSDDGVILCHDLELPNCSTVDGYRRFCSDFDKWIQHVEIPATDFQLGLGVIAKR